MRYSKAGIEFDIDSGQVGNTTTTVVSANSGVGGFVVLSDSTVWAVLTGLRGQTWFYSGKNAPKIAHHLAFLIAFELIKFKSLRDHYQESIDALVGKEGCFWQHNKDAGLLGMQ